MDVISGNIGNVGSYKAEIIKSKFNINSKVEIPVNGVVIGTVDNNISLDAAAVLDLIASKIPGTFDDAMIAVAKAALEKL